MLIRLLELACDVAWSTDVQIVSSETKTLSVVRWVSVATKRVSFSSPAELIVISVIYSDGGEREYPMDVEWCSTGLTPVKNLSIQRMWIEMCRKEILSIEKNVVEDELLALEYLLFQ